MDKDWFDRKQCGNTTRHYPHLWGHTIVETTKVYKNATDEFPEKTIVSEHVNAHYQCGGVDMAWW